MQEEPVQEEQEQKEPAQDAPVQEEQAQKEDPAPVVKKKKKWLIPVIIGVAVTFFLIVAIVVIIIVVAIAAPKVKFNKQLDLGEKYLTELDYDNAILSYEQAIKLNPKSEAAYLGLAGVYDTMAEDTAKSDPAKAIDSYEKAVDALDRGYNKTNSAEIANERSRIIEKKEKLEFTLREIEFYRACYYKLTEFKQDCATVDYVSKVQNRSIAFCDVYGDELPEMLYSKTIHSEYAYDFTYKQLYIATLQDGELTDIIEPLQYDLQVAGSYNYLLLKSGSSKSLYVYNEYGDEWWSTELSEFVPNLSGKMLTEKSLYTRSSHPNDDYSEWIDDCTKNGEAISLDLFNTEVNDFIANCNQIVFASSYYSGYDNQLRENKEDISMTYDEAISFLEQWLAENAQGVAEDADGDYAILSQIKNEFSFASGAGAWSTGIKINPDGTFEADYHDSNMGEGGSGYDATIYVSSCTGKFGKPVKINDYTYRMILEEINYNSEPGKETFETGEGYTVRYVDSDCYGLEEGKIFYIYLEGAPTEELPTEFVDWVRMPMGMNQMEKLPFDGLFNAEAGYGFFS